MNNPKKLILSNSQSPGDIVMLTAAVRDLHRTYPDQFLTDVRTSCPALWKHNPYITPRSLPASDAFRDLSTRSPARRDFTRTKVTLPSPAQS